MSRRSLQAVGAPRATLKVAVLKGGSSLERTVSLRSGARVQHTLRALGHDVIPIDVGPDLVERLLEAAPDAAFVALHGRNGEDGTVQGLLETLAIPYTGSEPGACLRCTDKALAKYTMRAAAIPTPPFAAFEESAIKELGLATVLPRLQDTIGLPLVVKPARQGSALGIKFARAAQELPAAIVGALSYDRKVVVERYVKGRDLAVSVLDSPPTPADPGPDPLALPIVEAIPREEAFYDYSSRYEIGMTTFVCPAGLDEALAARAQELALDVYRLLGCHGMARVDLMLDEQTAELTVLETNVVPGLTETSLLPQAADAAGIDFEELVARVLQSAFTR
ncbi:MAG TPA: D-alanine--D-alanine ligase [Solirubrobacteraceae bacterium]|nr:D-alanine--D-alanine ligase [Solirubrobacteraceae bacterium]